MDYLEYFGLSAEPFSHAPVSRFYYASRQHTDALKRLVYAAQTMKGLAILIGDVGHGKTTLARRLLDSLPPAEFEAAMLVVVHAGVTASWLLKRIATQLGVPEPADDKLTILSQLYARLVEIHKAGKRAVVLIDEAQMLGTRELMEEFRGLLNLEVPGHKLINFVFFGLPETERNLQLDPPLAQRVALRFHLRPLAVEDTTAYVRHRLKLAGARDELFPPDALAEVHRVTRGVPRVINTLCDNVLLELFFAKLAVATPELVAGVADNLGLTAPVAPPQPVAPPPDAPATPGSAGEDAVIALPRGEAFVVPDAQGDDAAGLDPHAIAALVATEPGPAAPPPAVDVSTIKPKLVVPAPTGAALAAGAPPPPPEYEPEPEPEILARYESLELDGEPESAPAAGGPAAPPDGASSLAAALTGSVGGHVPGTASGSGASSVAGLPAGVPPPGGEVRVATGLPIGAPLAPPPDPGTPGPVAPPAKARPARPASTTIRTSSGTIDLSAIDDLLADIERR